MSATKERDVVNVLIPLGPLSQDDVNCSILEYFSRHLTSTKVNAFVFSYSGTNEKKGEVDAVTKRFGCRKAAISIMDDTRLKKKVVDVPGASLEKTFVNSCLSVDSCERACSL